MPKGKAKSKADINKGWSCKYTEQGGYCNLPKFKRCEHLLVIRGTGDKACEAKI